MICQCDSPFQKSPIGFNMYCATFPRHLGRQIVRYLLAHPNGADTVELARWAYDEPLPSILVGHEITSPGSFAIDSPSKVTTFKMTPD